MRSLLIAKSLICLLIISTDVFAFEIGHTSIEFYDSSRNRNIETQIYYPAENSGENVPIASGNFPVIFFGHGFLMSWESYQNFWTELVPDGYILCFPTTEMGINTNHDNFGIDLRFLATQMQAENENSNSLFFNSIASKTGLMGHSMGGGASLLAAENNLEINTVINFAAAETTPSAISASSNITIPTLIFSGDDDCVTPANENQDLIYNNLASDCKTHINIIDGGHCYFADDNFTCTLGESLCNPNLNITREEQQSITFDFLKLWLDYSLYENQNAFVDFNDSLQTSPRINFSQFCNTTGVKSFIKRDEIKLFPNPVVDNLNLVLPKETSPGLLLIYNIFGEKTNQYLINESEPQINLSNLPNGIYFIEYATDSSSYSGKFIKNGSR
ncbi:MAG: T9SS type A sorting domain-containing protein [Bacteroidetes bacterium]|nr:T9SS type A sorting domain-containing protein [Bacteroidota bacterium]